jgi:hypothetical protein
MTNACIGTNGRFFRRFSVCGCPKPVLAKDNYRKTLTGRFSLSHLAARLRKLLLPAKKRLFCATFLVCVCPKPVLANDRFWFNLIENDFVARETGAKSTLPHQLPASKTPLGTSGACKEPAPHSRFYLAQSSFCVCPEPVLVNDLSTSQPISLPFE